MRDDFNASPINPLPTVVWFLALPIIAMEAVIALGQSGLAGGPGAEGWRLDAWQRFAFSPELMRAMIETGTYPWQGMIRLVSYPLVHASFLQALMAVVILLALGKMVAEVFRAWAVLAVFLGSAIVGALVYTALPMAKVPLIGAFPAVYGLIGAFTFLLWVNLAAKGANQYRAFTLIGMLLGIQLVFGLLFGSGYEWVAEVAGFATGFLLSFAVSPGGWARVISKMRRR
ncbi:rhomboid family intramembrane serine protease [Cereibacter sphaeroides]|uniref:rhomboid family intramembrane serine protease n=1 Tax=Rhodobacterales TaxID=204455 RepID=UPI000BBF136D|nr:MULTISPECIES: rhomboid family intramembrane serine protease [Paracoccaceae]MCE6951552.1 rhomboid family intramembrane serine protease [Cereibacter sphaeroides]MCE6959001.1 rhomboid family intramembrane serine protease [Cereibacter sphaeroides]MCE6969065.1 rhomboid family intramembrane serine protease [Cereibacter sphaeroides]MCE6973657.1 rhomboid family intramembrane serine protease [Cereibacter sphaeroides]